MVAGTAYRAPLTELSTSHFFAHPTDELYFVALPYLISRCIPVLAHPARDAKAPHLVFECGIPSAFVLGLTAREAIAWKHFGAREASETVFPTRERLRVEKKLFQFAASGLIAWVG